VGELVEELWQIPTVDAHEHLPAEKDHIEKPGPDFYTLFEHYCQADLRSAGADEETLDMLENRKGSLKDRWEAFKPLYEAIRTGSYARSARLVMSDLLEIDCLDDDTYPKVGRRLKELRTPGEYDRVLRDRCNIAACIECWKLGEE
jgi:hypothetical protein